MIPLLDLKQSVSVKPDDLILIGEILVFVLKALTLILGYCTIRLGARLLEQGVKGEFKFSGNFAGSKADLASASPGLLFVLLGTILMCVVLFVEKSWRLRTTDESAQESSIPPIPSKEEIYKELHKNASGTLPR